MIVTIGTIPRCADAGQLPEGPAAAAMLLARALLVSLLVGVLPLQALVRRCASAEPPTTSTLTRPLPFLFIYIFGLCLSYCYLHIEKCH